jgi:hypothetical protein
LINPENGIRALLLNVWSEGVPRRVLISFPQQGCGSIPLRLGISATPRASDGREHVAIQFIFRGARNLGRHDPPGSRSPHIVHTPGTATEREGPAGN